MLRLLVLISCWLLAGVTSAQAEDVTTNPAQLPALNALPDQTSISGLSSGGFMAAQFHLAYSEKLVGVGVMAGGPWNCVASRPENSFTPLLLSATTTCMDPCKYSWFGCPSTLLPNSSYLFELAKTEAERGSIGALDNLSDDKIYLFSGLNDDTVKQVVVDQTALFYQKFQLAEGALVYDRDIPAGHALITAKPTDNECSDTAKPWINNCGFSQARRLLEHIYGALAADTDSPKGELLRFDQKPFQNGEYHSLDDTGFVYVPQACRAASCRVHVALHGCRQGVEFLDDRYVMGSGYNQVADQNRIIVLYPQVAPSAFAPLNPRGCWDFWGYSSNNLAPYHYYKKSAPQMQAIQQMLERLSAQP